MWLLLWWLEFGVELIDEILVGGLEDSVNDVADQIFKSIQKIGESDEGALSLQVGVLSLQRTIIITIWMLKILILII